MKQKIIKFTDTENTLVVTSGDRAGGGARQGLGEGLVWDYMKSCMKPENCKEFKESFIQLKIK